MAYPYYGGYQQYPYMQQPTQMSVANQNTSPLIWVQGEAGAKSYIVPPGSTVLLMDSERARFYIKTADVSGMPQPLRIYEYNELTAQKQAEKQVGGEFVTRQEFDDLRDRMDALAAKYEEPKTVKRKAVTDNE